MNVRKLFSRVALAALGVSVSTAAFAANGSWTQIYTDNTNGIYVSAISSTVSLSTPPLPLKFQGSRVHMSVSSVSGTGLLMTPWATLAGPIGSSATVTGVSASLAAASTVTTSMTQITINNSYHDVGMTVSNTAGQLYIIRAVEFKQIIQ